MTDATKSSIALATGYASLIALAVCAYMVHGPRDVPDFALTVALGITGLIVGWVIGLLASPYEADESRRFAALTTAVTSFVSGYLVSKLDPLITAVLRPDAALAADRVAVLRLLAFICGVLIGGLSMYTYRAYIGPRRRQDAGGGSDSSTMGPKNASTSA